MLRVRQTDLTLFVVCWGLLHPTRHAALRCRLVHLLPQGERALGFVLGNQGMIDKTLLFDIDLIRIQK